MENLSLIRGGIELVREAVQKVEILYRKDRKELTINGLALRTLRLLSVLRG